MYSLTIEIPTQATDSNRILGVNKFVKHKIFKSIKEDTWLLAYGNVPDKPLEKFNLSITRFGTKPLDYDNLIASFKPYIDGIKLAGIIKDDSWKYIRSIEVDQVASKEKKLVIRIEEAK